MPDNEYHRRIVDYYAQTENAYKDSWDLDNSNSIHFGYWDDHVHNFPESLQRMNEMMMEAANIKQGERVLDAGCGVGGSSFYLASKKQCKVTGITLSDRQVERARQFARQKGLDQFVDFQKMDFSATEFPSERFDIIWACESVCYADDKQKFIQEAYRLLKPGGRLVVADGFVTDLTNNVNPLIRDWLDGWQVNYLESPERFEHFMDEAGFTHILHRDITAYTRHSSKRLHRFYYLANLWLAWKTISFSNRSNELQRKNIRACKYQYKGMKKGLWQYGIITGVKN